MKDSGPSFDIMGSGVVSGYFGAKPARSGHETTFVTRGAHLDAIKTGGPRVEDPGESIPLSVA